MIDLARLKARDASLGAFVDWSAAAGFGTGPLAGVTVGIKSNIAVASLAWTGGMGTRRGVLAEHDATVVKRLRDAGAAILGTLNMHEGALGATTDNVFYGRTHNPHRLGHTPGGSSGGSGAAVAVGLCDLALGTDTLGSVRIPAAYCGVYGLKPTHGAVPDDGLLFLEPALDTIGPLARDLDMVDRAWRVLVDARPRDGRAPARLVTLAGLNGVTVQPAVRVAYDRALDAVDLPLSELHLEDDATAIRMAGLVEAGAYLATQLGGARFGEGVSDELRFLLGACEGHGARPDVLARTRTAMVDAIGDDGVLVLPTTPQVAFAHGGRAPVDQADFTALANVAGLPALAVPAGRDAGGLPVSVQLVGPAGSEVSLIALARRLEPALGGAVLPPGDHA